MDKPGNDKTITIKINGKDRFLHEKDKVEPQKTYRFEEKSEYNDIEDLTARETAAGQELKDDDEFDWILPELDEEEELKEYKIAKTKKAKKSKPVYEVFSTPKKKQAKKSIIPSIVLTVFLAVLVGSSLGVLLLQMVISEEAVEVGGTPVAEEAPVAGGGEEPGTITAEIPAISSFVVQGGAFSSVEAAKVEAESISAKGVPVKAIEMGDRAFLFVGVADSLPNAKALGTLLQSNDVETFAKEVAFGGGSMGELHEGDKVLLEQAPALYQTLSNLTTTASLHNTVSSEGVDSLNTQLEKWNGLENPEGEGVQQLKAEMDKAIENMTSYIENKDVNLLPTIQQHLLNFLANYDAL